MPTTASRVTTVADAGALVDTLASGWDDLIELLRTIGPSALGALSLPSVPMVVGGAALVFIISLAWPPIEAGESDEDIAEWKKQQEEEKKNQKPATTDDDKNNDSSDEERETVTNNQGNEIDITPSKSHSTTRENPVRGQEPNSSIDILDENGNVKTRRWFDENGNAYRDVDMTNHGNPTTHPEWPHEHIWDWNQNPPRQ